MPLTIEEKKLWVEALRSCDYKQTKGTLHNLDDGGFCCLGLGAVALGWNSKDYIAVKPKYFFADGNPVDCGPEEVYVHWHETVGKDMTLLLTKMNDRGDTFEEIADWIEEKL